ncbi:MAG: glycosyltransferase family 2 protein [Cyanobacteria bacterium J06614_10]
MMKKVSVVVPVYGAEKFVRATIESLLSQTYENFEAIIVDDASPDGSIAICEQFDDPRLKIVHQENRGLPGARNTGIRHATGDYIALLDADDIWVPTKLEKHVEHLNQSPSVGISFSYSSFIDEAGNLIGLHQTPKEIWEITPSQVLCRNPVGNGSAAVVRREVFEDIKYIDDLHGQPQDFYFDERLRCKSADATDIECWLRMTITTRWLMAGIPEALTLYRVNSGGLSSNAMNQLDALDKVIEKTRRYAPDVLAKCEDRARAYHLRYTARRMVMNGDGEAAIALINQMFDRYAAILKEEPVKTGITASAAFALYLMPSWISSKLYDTAFAISKSVGTFEQPQQAEALN